MATVFFLPSSGSAAVSPAPSGADWGHSNTVSRPMLLSPSGTARTALGYSPDAADHQVDANAMCAQFVSDVIIGRPIPAQHVGIFLHASEPSTANNLFLASKLYAVDPTGASVLGTLLAIGRETTTEFVSGTARGVTHVRLASALDLTGQNFRLVFEVGWGGTPGPGGFQPRHNASLVFGDSLLSTQPQLVHHNSTIAALGFLLLTGGVGSPPAAGPAGMRGWAIMG